MPGSVIHQFANLAIVEKGWCAATPVQLLDDTVGIKQLPLQGDLPAQVFEVLVGAMVVFGDDLGAGAVIAHGVAKRDMKVQ